jgi:xylan 1,4-beta-xylosidase
VTASRSIAREDWERRVGLRTSCVGDADDVALRAPDGVVALSGSGQITLRWEPIAGAAGYLVCRADGPDAELAPLDHGGSDVLAIPAPPYADTEVAIGRSYRYAVAAASGPGRAAGPWSKEVSAVALAGPAASLAVNVDAGRTVGRLDRVWRMVGAERLSQLLEPRDAFGNDIGAEFLDALTVARRELGVEMVRAHAIYHDDLSVFRWSRGAPQFDFEHVDRVLDRFLETGLRPVLELSFMPRDLARDPDATVFDYRAVISPPRDWEVWAELNGRLAEHLIGRYGADEVARWAFEVWNEPNLAVFWTGTRDEYLRLYETAARAVKSVDERLRVGGPATAAAEWIDEFAAFAAERGAPVDFVSTHTYGNVPLDFRPALDRHGLGGLPIWWTEWGVGATHFGPIHDAPYGAPFVLRGLKAVQGRLDALAYWVVSDHFEELGRPPRLLHDGFGLLTVGNLRKPRFWALTLAAQLGDDLVAAEIEGDGAESLVDAWAARGDDGRVDVLLWNGALNAAKAGGDPALARTVRLRIDGLDAVAYQARLARIDESNSNIARHVAPDVDWPTREQWEALRRHDRLDERPVDDLELRRGTAELELSLPNPGVVRLRLQPLERRPKGGTLE